MPWRTRVCVFLFLATTGGLPVVALGSGQSVAQSAGSSAEQQIYDRYRDWTSSVPVDQRGPGLLALYRQHLQKQGVPPVEIDRQLAIIEREGRGISSCCRTRGAERRTWRASSGH